MCFFLLKRHQVRVVIGNSEENINELISECIKDIINDKYDLTITSVAYGEELLEFAKFGGVNIFIVIVNNIRFRPSYTPQEHLEKSLQLITQIKKIYGMPVIALSPALPEESVKQTGADFYFPLPFNFDDFKMAFEKCMYDMLAKAREAWKRQQSQKEIEIVRHIKAFIKVAVGLLLAAGVLFILFWIGKAILGFIKYYSQFA